MNQKEKIQLKRHVLILMISTLLDPPVDGSSNKSIENIDLKWEKALDSHFKARNLYVQVDQKEKHLTINLDIQ